MIGDVSALACALCFALCSMAFAGAGRVVGAARVNQTRLVAAVLILVVVHFLLLGEAWPGAFTSRETNLLLVSGFIGLAFGDQCYFHALMVLGPRLGTLMMSTFPVFSLVADGLLRGHWPAPTAGLWMVVCVFGVALVLADRRGGQAAAGVVEGRRGLAILAGVFGALSQGVGLVLTRLADDVDPGTRLDSVSMTLVRMVAGMVGLLVLMNLPRLVRRPTARAQAMTRRAFGLILVGVVFGPTLGVWLSTVAVQNTAGTGRASVLIALTPVMMIPIGRLVYGDRPGLQGVVGTLVAFGATAALLLGQG